MEKCSSVETLLGLLADSGLHPTIAGQQNGWTRLELAVDSGLLTLFCRPLAPPFNGDSLLPFQLALPAGLTPYDLKAPSEPDQLLFFPSGASGHLIVESIAKLGDPGYRSIVLNTSAETHMAGLAGKFYSAILVYFEDDQQLSKSVKVWRRSGAGHEWLRLPISNSPFVAADQALEEHDILTTVYRCTSGQFVAFKPTCGLPLI